MTDTDTPAPILAAAMSDADFDGRTWISLGRVDRERYIARATRAHGACLAAPGCRPSDQAPSGLAASGASIPRAQWQPIATAPKDWGEFLAYRPDQGVFVCRWESMHSVVPKDIHGDPTEPYDDEFEWWWCDIFGWLEGDLTPTHWMPLPPPPRVSDGSAVGDETRSGLSEGNSAARRETPEEIAQSILNPHASWFASNPRVVASVAKALRTARNEALEDAVKKADEAAVHFRNEARAYSEEGQSNSEMEARGKADELESLATAIRDLKS